MHGRALRAVHWAAAQKIKIEQHAASGGFWFAAWLFTIGILDLSFGKAVLAVVVWPYYLGQALTHLL